MPSTRYLSAIVFAFASLKVAIAIPVAETIYPEVIPGPGLPSLAELGHTSAQLYQMSPDEAPDSLLSRGFTGKCGPDNAAYTDVADIIACYNYLRNLGTKKCSVPSGFGVVQMCHAGKGQISGQGYTEKKASSYCRDVASGALWVINGCTRPDQTVAGFQAAGGNGDLIVGCTNIKY